MRPENYKQFEGDAGPYCELGALADKLLRKRDSLSDRAYVAACDGDIKKYEMLTAAAEKVDKELIGTLKGLDKRGYFAHDKDIWGLNGPEKRREALNKFEKEYSLWRDIILKAKSLENK